MPFGSTHSHGDLHRLEIIEDKNGPRRKNGFPARYAKGRFLGKGGFAKVYEVQDMETKEIFAAKIIEKASVAKPRAMAKLRSEIAIHRSLDHDKVVKFFDHFEDSEYVYIILELCPNQTLNDFMRKRPNKRLSEPEAMFYIYELIVALKYLHQKRVIHRDLKLGNLFLDADAGIKLGDFGLAALLERDGERRRTICGTPNYIAPEILESKHGHSYEVDVWSLGVILYALLIGRPPFETADVKTTYRRIRYNQYGFPDTVRISDAAKELITSILRTEPHSRPSLDKILQSPWFQNSGHFPPPRPISAGGLTVTPRVGSSSARGETPERGGADFARIDSPFHMRDRSPSPALGAQVAQDRASSSQPRLPPNAALWNGQAPASYAGSMTPGRYTPSVHGRPPLASQRGNEENVPTSNNVNGSAANAMAPKVTKHGSGMPRSSSSTGHISSIPTPCRNSAVPVSARETGGSTFRTVAGMQHTPRDQSPFQSVATAQLPSRSGHMAGEQLPRSASHAPTRSGTASLPSPIVGGVTTPREVRSRSAKELNAADSYGGGFCSEIEVASARVPSLTPQIARMRDTTDAGRRTEEAQDAPYSGRGAFGSTARIPQCMSGRSDTSGAGTYRFASTSGQSYNADPQAKTLPLEGPPEVWVTKWVDYSSKYGVGYILSDGYTGVYFNDSTKIILTPDGSQFDYITRRTQEKPETKSTHTFDKYPDDLKKKVTLLRHFKNYMVTDSLDKKDGATMGESSLTVPTRSAMIGFGGAASSSDSSQAPYVKKWTRNKHAIMFQLSNKIVQVAFFDKTEMVLSSTSNSVTYVDKKGQVLSYPLKDALDVPNVELAKRLRYTKDILVNLLGARPNDLVPAN